MIALGITGIIVLLVIIGVVFMYTSPQFGAGASDQQKAAYKKTGHFEDEKFINAGGVTSPSFSFPEMISLGIKFFSKQPKAIPESVVPVEKIGSLNIVEFREEKPRVVWFGHSALLLQIDGKNILLDPMLGDVPAPHPMLGNARFNKELPLEIEKLPQIDAVIFSHDHYDHLDYESVVKLKDIVEHFYTPLGVGNHIASWGVPKEKISQLDWWEEVSFKGIKFVCTPAQHFSGRGLSDGAATLWSSWVIQSNNYNIYFSGDSGYGPHFKDIGTKYGPFDFAMIECCQYNELCLT